MCAFSVAFVVTQGAVDRRPPMPVDPASTALRPQGRSSGLHGPALRDMVFRNRASSNFSSNIVSGSGSTDFVEDLVRLQAQAAGDDFLLDFGGAAEDRSDTAGQHRAHDARGAEQPGQEPALVVVAIAVARDLSAVLPAGAYKEKGWT